MNHSTQTYQIAKALLKRARQWKRVHLVTGLIGSFWLLIMSLTGIALNHLESVRASEILVPYNYLPDHYVSELRPEGVPLSVVLVDLHSGRFFGEHGPYVSDFFGAMLVMSIATGLRAYWIGKKARNLLSALGVTDNNGKVQKEA